MALREAHAGELESESAGQDITTGRHGYAEIDYAILLVFTGLLESLLSADRGVQHDQEVIVSPGRIQRHRCELLIST
jgi:hypothetical protein